LGQQEEIHLHNMVMFAFSKAILLSRVSAANAMKNAMSFQKGGESLGEKFTSRQTVIL
jgi:hypothetical protein